MATEAALVRLREVLAGLGLPADDVDDDALRAKCWALSEAARAATTAMVEEALRPAMQLAADQMNENARGSLAWASAHYWRGKMLPLIRDRPPAAAYIPPVADEPGPTGK